ncbi:MAG TPA: flippase activity-associated protein Agl23 [Pyrinomonadaceae bacterium]|nr:flippase activity-associated protein Agl23 [Pyrinomonadaceae bacterium]
MTHNSAVATATEPPDQPGENAGLSRRVWWIASLSILAAAAFVRVYALGLKPMHHDEGVNGFFLTTLYRDGVYHYNHENYHGPTLYYFALAVTKLKAFLFGEPGLGTIAVRLVPALFGVATVWLVLGLRRNIGAAGALAAAALVALSPGDVYVSRYFIHETQFVFFTLGVVVAALRYWETTDPVYLLFAAISAALLTATKETALISLVVLGLAWAVSSVYMRLTDRGGGHVPWEPPARQAKGKKRKGQHAAQPGALERLGGWKSVAPMAALALFLFLFINVLFYSSFFTNREGVGDALKSFQVWAKTGTKEHGHPWHTYLWWLWQEQAPLLILGAAGSIAALIRRHRFGVFAGAWAFGILAAYSLIPYKTPWLMLSFTVPLAVISGYAVNVLYHSKGEWPARLAALAVTLAALAVSGVQTARLNFYYYDDDTYPYVYAHTYRDFLPLVNKIDELAERAGTGRKTEVAIVADEYWPLPWYLREYEHAGFFGYVERPNGDLVSVKGPIVISTERQEIEKAAQLQEVLGDRYVRVDAYPLRPGVTLVLYARPDLVEGRR